jgi:hypothetical protein
MTGEYRLNASRETVFDALNDPEILKQCIPGCEEIVKTSDTEMTAKVVAKVGPVKAKFSGAVTLSDLNRPESYTITGEGKGGAAGFAKGGAKIRLEPDGDGTLMLYDVHADIGGKLAQLGSRLIDGTAKKMSKDFFDTFGRLVDGEEVSAEGEAAAAEAAPGTAEAVPEAAKASAPGKSGSLSPMVWVIGVILLAAVAVLISLS